MRIVPRFVPAACGFGLLLFASCQTRPAPVDDAPRWAIAIHGGAGTMDPDTPPEQLEPYREALARALALGRGMIEQGASALDVCEAVVRDLEDDPLFNAGRGAVFNDRHEHELDASIMDGATLRCGAVAGVRTVRHPISLARRVMTETPHVLLAGTGAESFADGTDLERVENAWFDTDRRRRAVDRVLEERARTGRHGLPADHAARYGTVGCVVRDAAGRLAAATSTGGMTAKRWGRVGDTPILGAGNYADGWAAVSCTGTGEEFIRHGIARAVSARMEFGGATLRDAAGAVIHDVLQPGDGGLIAVDRDGNIATPFNSSGMYRAVADATGRSEVAVFGSGR